MTRLVLAAVSCLALAATTRAAAPTSQPAMQTAELVTPIWRVRVPIGTYTAPPGGAANYRIPGPIAAIHGPDGQWRGSSYLETYPRLTNVVGSATQTAATVTYTFEGGKQYVARLAVKGDTIVLDEQSDLGPRNLWVLDLYDHWQPKAGFALDIATGNSQFLYLPCMYDKPEATINPAAARASKSTRVAPTGVGVLSADAASKDVFCLWCVEPTAWKAGDTMGFQLWQRRQLPNDPSSRHFLGPETKSDESPNPHTTKLMGKSLYQGHVTIEFNLGTGTRTLAMQMLTKPDQPQALSAAIKAAVAKKED